MTLPFSMDVRVRYCECDPMNFAHHATYPVWLEMVRTELMRSTGLIYREVEASGLLFVVARLSLRYRKPARYDDLLSISVTKVTLAGVKIEHDYAIHRQGVLLCTAQTTLVCTDKAGRLLPVPTNIAKQTQ